MATKIKSLKVLKSVPYIEFVYASLTLAILPILFVLISKNLLPPVVPLLYGRPEGAGELVTTIYILLGPGTAVLITVINVLIAIKTENVFIKKVLVFSAFLASTLAAITIFRIIFLVGYF